MGGPVKRPRNTPVPKEVIDEIARLYPIYLSTRKVSRYVGVDRNTVFKYLKRRGVKLKPQGAYRLTCMVCGKKTGGKKRCAFHQALFKAEWQAEYRRNNPGRT